MSEFYCQQCQCYRYNIDKCPHHTFIVIFEDGSKELIIGLSATEVAFRCALKLDKVEKLIVNGIEFSLTKEAQMSWMIEELSDGEPK